MCSKKPTPCSARTANPLADFYEELYAPLDEVFNLVFVAQHEGTDTRRSAECLDLVVKRLSEVRKAVLEHCRNQPDENRKAS